MKWKIALWGSAALLARLTFAADNAALLKTYDGAVKSAESEVVSLAKAMPAEKYGFAPTGGAFQGVRTFAAQVKHLAAVNYMVAAAALGEKPPVDTNGESGPEAASSKEAVVAFLEGSFAYLHKAAQAMTAGNQMEEVKAPFGNSRMTRAELVNLAVSHSFDHYGQMVVYARMNGIVPPASR